MISTSLPFHVNLGISVLLNQLTIRITYISAIDIPRLTKIVYRPGYFTVHPPPAPSGPKFSNSENC